MQVNKLDLAILSFVDCARSFSVIKCGHVSLVLTANPFDLPPGHQDSHNLYEFLIPLSSIPQLFVEDREIDCLPGNLIPINPGLRHGVRHGRKALSFILIMFDSEHMDRMIRLASGEACCLGFPVDAFPLKTDIQLLVTRLIHEDKEKGMGWELMMRCLADELAILLIRHYYQPSGVPGLITPEHLTGEQFRFQNAISFMQEQYSIQVSIERLARMSSMNSFHFIRTFKKNFDISPYNYLTRIRITNAKRLLIQTTLSAAQIGKQCGFQSASRFSAVFLKDTGLTPSRFRRINRNH